MSQCSNPNIINDEEEDNDQGSEFLASPIKGPDHEYDTEQEEHEGVESACSNAVMTPNGTTKYFPHIDDHLKFDTTKIYGDLEQAINAYVKYAEASGFGTRLNTTKYYLTDGSLKYRYVLCNKAGKPKKRVIDTLDSAARERNKRNSSYKVTNCQARIIIHRDFYSGKFSIHKFVEEHNHPLSVTEENRLSSKKRRLHFSDQQFVVNASRMNVGATKAHRYNTMLKGGYDNVAPKKVEYKNFWRDFNAFVGKKDAQCIVDEMNFRKDNFPNFSFEYKLDGRELCGMFWADCVAKANYKEFSDVISFDATFRANKYDMVFVPFTAIDHHKKSVNVGAALLAHETIENYTWLLKAFVNAHGKQPRLVLSDQDPAMKQAISTVLTESTHRLCMWHIMTNMRKHVSPKLMINSDFKKRMDKLVWNVNLDPEVFECQWTDLMKEYNLTEHSWLSQKYNCRESWIPAYFKTIQNCGLMKTTSRSESANSFFNSFSHNGHMLVNFMMNFDTALEKQRIEQRTLDDASNNSKPAIITDEELELHAAEVYTRSVFLEVQKEIKKATSVCFQKTVLESEGVEIVTIIQKKRRTSNREEYKVRYSAEKSEFICSCDHFNIYGLLCCHVFRVMMNYDYVHIPEQYVLRRWTKNCISKDLLRSKQGWSQKDNSTTELVKEAYTYMESCIDKLVSNPDALKEYVEKQRIMKESVDEMSTENMCKRSKEETFRSLLGVTIPEKIDIEIPSGIRNKGSGRTRRFIGSSEKIMGKTDKKARLCTGCNKRIRGHNLRTCPQRKTNSSVIAVDN